MSQHTSGVEMWCVNVSRCLPCGICVHLIFPWHWHNMLPLCSKQTGIHNYIKLVSVFPTNHKHRVWDKTQSEKDHRNMKSLDGHSLVLTCKQLQWAEKRRQQHPTLRQSKQSRDDYCRWSTRGAPVSGEVSPQRLQYKTKSNSDHAISTVTINTFKTD